MTGKEDLFETSTSCVDIENDVWDILNFEIMKALKKENEELSKKLEKYKRAFEIFKRLINDEFAYIDLENGVFDGTIDITEEEVELLEELIRDGKVEN